MTETPLLRVRPRTIVRFCTGSCALMLSFLASSAAWAADPVAKPANEKGSVRNTPGSTSAAPEQNALSIGTPLEGGEWQLSRYRIDLQDPVSSVPTTEQRDANPLEFGYHLQDLATMAKKQERLGHLEKAVKFWLALAKAVPDANAGFFGACAVYEKLGQREKAIEYCEKALVLPPEFALGEFVRYSRLVLGGAGSPSADAVAKVDATIAHLRQQKAEAAPEIADRIACDLAVRLSDVQRLEPCAKALAASSPKDPTALTYSWALAMEKGNLSEAQKVLDQLKQQKLPAAEIEKMARSMHEASQPWRSWLRRWPWAAGALGIVLCGVLLLALRLTKFGRLTEASAPLIR